MPACSFTWKSRVICLIFLFAFVTIVCSTGFLFVVNQYIYFRYLEDVGLPYSTKKADNTCGANNSTDDPQKQLREQAQARTAKFLAAAGLISLASGMFSSMFVGRISDRYGRRMTIGVILLGIGLYHVLLTLLVLFHWPVYVVFPAYLISGLVGGGMISLMVQISVCFADLTKVPPQTDESSAQSHRYRNRQDRHRLLLLGFFDGVSMIATALGNFLMGTVIEKEGFIVSVLGLLALFCVPVLLIWFLPETKDFPYRPSMSYDDELTEPLQQDSQSESVPSLEVSTQSRSGCCGGKSKLSGMLQVFKTHRWATFSSLILLFLFALVIISEGQFTFLYLMSVPFCWTPEGVGIYNGIGLFLMAPVSFGLTFLTAWSMKSKKLRRYAEEAESKQNYGSTCDSASVSEDVGSTSGTYRSRSVTTGERRENEEEEGQEIAAVEPAPSSPQADVVNLIVKRNLLRSRCRMLIYVCIGFLAMVVSKLIMGFAFTFPVPRCSHAAYIALFVGFVRSAVVPTLKSFISSLHPASEQGRVFSLIGLSEFAGLLVGVPGLPAVYSATVSFYPGAVFLLSAGLLAVGLFLSIFLLVSTTRKLARSRSKPTVPVTSGSSRTLL
ncbi:unnamed protein product [Calicophoron daubneyi]|uniref:Uncharacterized protein n=1 Tax=Calicophoron daubneyi TaxID=300641 RepID=A0AAV2THF8_CALDB